MLDRGDEPALLGFDLEADDRRPQRRRDRLQLDLGRAGHQTLGSAMRVVRTTDAITAPTRINAPPTATVAVIG